MLYRIERVQQVIKPKKTTTKKSTKKIIESPLDIEKEKGKNKDKNGKPIEFDTGKEYKEISEVVTDEVTEETSQAIVKEIFNLIEICTGKVVYSSERRIAVVNKKNQLEGWRNKKHKQKWN